MLMLTDCASNIERRQERRAYRYERDMHGAFIATKGERSGVIRDYRRNVTTLSLTTGGWLANWISSGAYCLGASEAVMAVIPIQSDLVDTNYLWAVACAVCYLDKRSR